ncbi:MAG: hypothetical protein NZM27_09525, partial [Acetobacteraceae bacterium]|nr:hypothetical protein [Acetobacteraceae bacterium]
MELGRRHAHLVQPGGVGRFEHLLPGALDVRLEQADLREARAAQDGARPQGGHHDRVLPGRRGPGRRGARAPGSERAPGAAPPFDPHLPIRAPQRRLQQRDARQTAASGGEHGEVVGVGLERGDPRLRGLASEPQQRA